MWAVWVFPGWLQTMGCGGLRAWLHGCILGTRGVVGTRAECCLAGVAGYGEEIWGWGGGGRVALFCVTMFLHCEELCSCQCSLCMLWCHVWEWAQLDLWAAGSWKAHASFHGNPWPLDRLP